MQVGVCRLRRYFSNARPQTVRCLYIIPLSLLSRRLTTVLFALSESVLPARVIVSCRIGLSLRSGD